MSYLLIKKKDAPVLYEVCGVDEGGEELCHPLNGLIPRLCYSLPVYRLIPS